MKKPGKSRIPDSPQTQFEESDMDQSSYFSSEDEKEEEIKKELFDVTFGELQRACSNETISFFQKNREDKMLKRANKNRPMEASSKKSVPALREVIQAPKKIVHDPRFESLCGRLDPEGFRKRYNFLYENDLPTEKEGKQLKSSSSKHIDAEILAKHKKKEREAAKQGKRPFYLKNSKIQKQRLIEKYKQLKSSGKLEAFVEKRRRKNAAKDHRHMPYSRSSDNVE